MTSEERRRIEMLDRLTDVLGVDVADTLLGHLPPPGGTVATASQVDQLARQLAEFRRWTEEQFADERRWTEEQFADERRWTEERLGDVQRSAQAQTDGLRSEMHHLFELHTERMTSRWRRDLLVIATPQFLVLLAVVASLNL